MDQHKPLSYECLKTVIQYRDANFRLIRSRQIPSLRNIQKVVPLRLDVLHLDNSTLIFGNVHYQYQHCRKFIERDGGPVTVQYSKYDLNNYGDKEILEDVMPGDIVIKYRHGQNSPNRNRHFISDSYVSCNVWAGLNNQCRSCESRVGIKMRDMMRKKLYEVLGGKCIHQVEHLEIGIYRGILRLPEDLKLKIRELGTGDNSMAVIDAILPILDRSSFPLKSLSIILKNPEDTSIQSEILRTSESLTIYNTNLICNGWANLLINLPNMKVHLKKHLPVNEIFLIIRNWMEHPRVIGTRLSMQPVYVEIYLNEIKKEFKATRVVLPERECTLGFTCFTLPMTSTSELNIYETNSPNDEKYLEGKPWRVVMEVMPIGTAKPSKDQ